MVATCRTLWSSLNKIKALEQGLSEALTKAMQESFEKEALRHQMNALAEARKAYQTLLEERVDLGDHRQIQLQDYLALRRCTEGSYSHTHEAPGLWKSFVLGTWAGGPRIELDHEGRVNSLALCSLVLSKLSIPGALTRLAKLKVQLNVLTQLSIPDTLTSLTELWVNNNRLTEFVIPKTLTNLEDLRAQHNRLREIVIPDTLKSLDGLDLCHNPELTTVTIPEKLAPSSVRLWGCSLSDSMQAEAKWRDWSIM